ncbi:unnamed protein product [Effrenium voratum]|uniref:Uncharacterized protein n=1 Tax=Effrenium voratum TaxID=2562239 RepID=A0AA36II74_9DINO|nr:unnamed protein product [Effrenium voratum]CAJ1453064.1 unnamed protein product [Effrenium voratum]|mmetsp:Transcript_124493/g.295423  ORF Transcript_124493/g.295423 Transcript_124493/m.295423 type:complete len:394 (+) Transcript_124493:61-1242(+)|eukprot:CAMPEP_0181446696 /NCGR_PEP_ID=MMETSP1110-20121109/26241_1 /TAXON_ID=174948 /ORGANISM="Symbiodinium sp., Strain CCMP421" /LENGTH=393 /DNA_ID=CAMNT_0023570789 /DNA_START=31 /DNA_END=1212 /DNA_ORIENTATION=+
MPRAILSSSSATTVAQQLSDLLQCFPAAAIGGVQWKTLLQKYEERYSTRLDIFSLGHETPLAASTMLLFDVLRLVNSEDGDNPIVAVEDEVALVPKPGSASSWPSLYQVLCTVVRENGTVDEEGGQAILVSQLKPLLQRMWHNTFDEASFGYLTEEGSSVKMRKMKHLLQALLRWRSQRLEWNGRSCRAMDEALRQELELVPSKRHNDLLLRFVSKVDAPLCASEVCICPTVSTDDDAAEVSLEISSRASTMSSAVQEELAALRAENEKLRCRNNMLESTVSYQDNFITAQLPENLFDNPYEPPPQVWHSASASPTASTVSHSGFSGSESGTPMGSGHVTPVPLQVGHPITLVPMGWFMGDRGIIPCGLVQQARAVFEQHRAIPNWFCSQQQP